jgi:two-component system NtrC family sensor kinase
LTTDDTAETELYMMRDKARYRDIRRRVVFRLYLMYIAPLATLALYFFIQYGAIVDEGNRLHLKAIAESQANTLDLYLTERIVNVSNIIDNPAWEISQSSESLARHLKTLQMKNDAFVDIGYVNESGTQIAYLGPFEMLEEQDYGSESWFLTLSTENRDHIITDIYLGFREKPHFTIAVRRLLHGRTVVLRAALDPVRMYEYISTLKGSHEVLTSVVNQTGLYQLVTPDLGIPLENSLIVPPLSPSTGADEIQIEGQSLTYAYVRLRSVDWVLITQQPFTFMGGILSGFSLRMILIASVFVLFGLLMIHRRARKIVALKIETEHTRAQLSHAAKLASIGQLAAGIAHEINNPLAAINEEAGLLKDLINPEFGKKLSDKELNDRLDSIEQLVFRCRDITQKLLKFVRKTDIELRKHEIHPLIDEVVDGLLGPRLAVSNIKVIRKFCTDCPEITTDGNQLQQVFLNIVTNALDAMRDQKGTLTIITDVFDNKIRIDFEDTGHGIAPEHIDKIFNPFFTTKDVGKGTGLGMSASYSIIKSLDGEISVESEVGSGTKFTILLPET